MPFVLRIDLGCVGLGDHCGNPDGSLHRVTEEEVMSCGQIHPLGNILSIELIGFGNELDLG